MGILGKLVKLITGIWTSPSPLSTGLLINADSVKKDTKFIVGSTAGGIAVSNDDPRYSNLVQTLNNTNKVNTIAYNGSIYVAGGITAGFGLYSSPDGITWTRRDSTYGYLRVQWLPAFKRFIAVGYSGIIKTSDDGITWTQRTSGTINNYTGIATNGSRILICNSDAVAGRYSDDGGITWTGTWNTGSGVAHNNIIYANGLFVVVSGSGRISKSSDGTTWTTYSHPITYSFNDIVWDGTKFVAVGDSTVILTSTDAATWTTRNPPINLSGILSCIIWTGSKFYAAGNNGIIESVDGITWVGTELSLINVNTLAYNSTAKTRFIDQTGNNTITTVGAGVTLSTTQSKFGGSSLYFDGTANSYIQIPHSNTITDTDSITVEFWVYPISGSGKLAKFNSATGEFDYGLGFGSNLSRYTSASGPSAFATGSLLNTWIRVVGLYNYSAKTVRWIVYDGVNVQLDVTSTLTVPRLSNKLPLQIGNVGTDNFVGYIDDIRITNGIVYTGTFAPAAAPLSSQLITNAAYSVVTETGSKTVGQAVTFSKSNVLAATVGNISASGQDITFSRGYSLPISPFIASGDATPYQFTNPNVYNTSINDKFGQSVAVSNNYIAVHSFNNDGVQTVDIFDSTTRIKLRTISIGSISFKASIALTDNHLVVTAPYLNGINSEQGCGEVRVYNPNTGVFLYKITNPVPENNVLFGYDGASIYGNTLIVSCARASAVGNEVGATYAFNLTDGTLLHTFLSPDSTTNNQHFGTGTAINANYVAISAPDANSYIGLTYVYDRSTWNLLYTLSPANAISGDTNTGFGTSVALSGNYLIVGTPHKGTIAAPDISDGAAQIFDLTTGLFVREIVNPNPDPTNFEDQFGYNVKAYGDYAAINAPLEANGFGKVYIFNFTDGSLVNTINNPNPNVPVDTTGQFGYTMDLYGTKLVIGSPEYQITTNSIVQTSSGKTFVYDIITAASNTIDNPNAIGGSYNDEFGSNAKINGNYLIIAAVGEANSNGAVYVFDKTSKALLYSLLDPNIDNATQDSFGYSLATDGNYLVVSARYEQDPLVSTTFNSGRVYIYDLPSGNLLRYINGTEDTQSTFGNSLELRGTQLFVGASQATGGALGNEITGRVYSYDVTDGSLLYTLNNPNVFSSQSYDEFGSKVSTFGNYIVSSTSNGEVLVFDSTTNALLYRFATTSSYDNSTGSVPTAGLGNYLLIGDPQAYTSAGIVTGDPRAGQVKLYELTTGSLIHTFNDPLDAYNDSFGISVAINSNWIAIGSTTGYVSRYQGKIYVYDRTTYSLVRTIDNPNWVGSPQYDYFGTSVALSGDIVIGGAPGDGAATQGEISAFDITTGSLIFDSRFTSTTNYARIGQSTSASTNYIVTSGYAANSNAGEVLVFDLAGTLLHTITNPNPTGTAPTQAGDDWFGIGLAVTDTYLVIGAPYTGVNTLNPDSIGTVYVYNTVTGALLHTIQNPIQTGYHEFGKDVAIYGDRIVVGSPGTRSGVAEVIVGKVYVYSASTGALISTINNSSIYGGMQGDEFGWAIASSNDYVAVSARREDSLNKLDAGAVYVFNRATGSLVHTIINSSSTLFGSSLFINGVNLYIGSIGDSDSNGFYSGAVYVYDINTGGFLSKVVNPNSFLGSTNDEFSTLFTANNNYLATLVKDASPGNYTVWVYDVTTKAVLHQFVHTDNVTSLKIHGTKLAIGLQDSNVVYVRDLVTGSLVHTINDPLHYPANTSNRFGISVDIDDNYIIIGAEGSWDSIGNYNSGIVYVFDATTGSLLHTILNPLDGTSNSYFNRFGCSVAFEGDYLVVGAKTYPISSGAGIAYVYQISTNTLLNTLNNPALFAGTGADNFGQLVKIVGNYIVVGDPGEDTSTNVESGAICVFNKTTGALLYTISNPTASIPGATGQYFGSVFDVTSSYITVGVSNYIPPALGVYDGVVYVFDITDGTLVRTISNPNINGSDANANTDYFGTGLSTYSNHLIVSAPAEKSPTGYYTGIIYDIDLTTGNVISTIEDPNPYGSSDSDQFGTNVSVSGSTLVVGAPGEGFNERGVIYTFNTLDLSLVSTIANPANNYFAFGQAFAVDNNGILAGLASFTTTGEYQTGTAYYIPFSGSSNKSFELTGQAAILSKNYIFATTNASYTLTGQDAGSLTNYVIQPNHGSYSLTGLPTGYIYNKVIGTNYGSFALNGQTAGSIRHYVLNSEVGSFTLNGQSTNSLRHYAVASTYGAYTLNGQVANSIRGRVVTGTVGSVALNGQPVTWLRNYAVSGTTATYTLSGQPAGSLRKYATASAYGSFALNGQDVSFLKSFKLYAFAGTVNLNGQAVNWRRTYVKPTDVGSFSLNGQNAIPAEGRKLPAEFLSTNLTGQAVTLRNARAILANAGTYAESGQVASLVVNRKILINAGALTETGQAVTLRNTRAILANVGSYTETPQQVGLFFARKLTAVVGSFSVNGQSVGNGRSVAGTIGTIASIAPNATPNADANISVNINSSDGTFEEYLYPPLAEAHGGATGVATLPSVTITSVVNASVVGIANAYGNIGTITDNISVIASGDGNVSVDLPSAVYEDIVTGYATGAANADVYVNPIDISAIDASVTTTANILSDIATVNVVAPNAYGTVVVEAFGSLGTITITSVINGSPLAHAFPGPINVYGFGAVAAQTREGSKSLPDYLDGPSIGTARIILADGSTQQITVTVMNNEIYATAYVDAAA